MNKKNARVNIGIVTLPISKAGVEILDNLLQILTPLVNTFFIITGDYGEPFSIEERFPDKKIKAVYLKSDTKRESIWKRVAKYALLQLKTAVHLWKMSRHVDIFLFSLGGSSLPLPILIAELRLKRTIVTATGSAFEVSLQTLTARYGDHQGRFLAWGLNVVERICYSICDRIIIYSENSVENSRLARYKSKIYNGAFFADVDLFKLSKPLSKRKRVIGYIGRFSEEKGIMNFIRAIPLVLKEEFDTEFIIGGGGMLFDKIERELRSNDTYDRVTLMGWIPHEELPEYLNKLNLFVLPSYTEGLPSILLEAMACGTPVLATPVGRILDVVKDKQTGFILENNSPEHIAQSIIKILKYPDLAEVANNARRLIEERYTYEAAVGRYRNILYGGD